MPNETDELEVKSWDDSSIVQIPAQVVSAYSNNVRFGFTNWDMWFVFGEIAGEKEGKLMIAPRARVVMSLSHAKAFLQAFQSSMEKFEKDFGEIKVLTPLETPDSETK